MCMYILVYIIIVHVCMSMLAWYVCVHVHIYGGRYILKRTYSYVSNQSYHTQKFLSRIGKRHAAAYDTPLCR